MAQGAETANNSAQPMKSPNDFMPQIKTAGENAGSGQPASANVNEAADTNL